MISDQDEIKYKNLFRKNEENTVIPEFDDILNLPRHQKNRSGKLIKIGPVMILCLLLVIGIYSYRRNKTDSGVSKNETELFEDNKSFIWQWTSPTHQLLAGSSHNPITSFNMPTDFLSHQKISLQKNNKKTN